MHAAFVAVQLAFSGMHVVGKAVLAVIDPLALASMRVLVATPILLLWAWRRDRALPARRDLPRLALLGLFGVCLNQILFISGLELTRATNAAILMPSIPVFAVAAGALLGVERLGRAQLAGVGLAVAGALALLDPRQFALAAASTVGDLMILANCLSFALFLVLQRPLLERLPWRTVLAWSFLLGAPGVVAMGGRRLAALEPAAVAPEIWLGVAFVVLVPTLAGYSLNTWAVRRSGAALAASYTTLQPLVTALLAAAFLGERPGAGEAAGFAAIAAGLVMISRRRRLPAG